MKFHTYHRNFKKIWIKLQKSNRNYIIIKIMLLLAFKLSSFVCLNILFNIYNTYQLIFLYFYRLSFKH